MSRPIALVALVLIQLEAGISTCLAEEAPVSAPASSDVTRIRAQARGRGLLPGLLEDADRISSRVERLKAYNMLIDLYIDHYPDGLEAVITRGLSTAQDLIYSSAANEIPTDRMSNGYTNRGPISRFATRAHLADQALKRDGKLARSVQKTLLEALETRAGQEPALKIESILDTSILETPVAPAQAAETAAPTEESPVEMTTEPQEVTEVIPALPVSKDIDAQIRSWFVRRKQIEGMKEKERSTELQKLLEEVLKELPNLHEVSEPLLAWVSYEAEALDTESFLSIQLDVATKYWEIAENITDPDDLKRAQLCGAGISASHYAASKARFNASARARAGVYSQVASRLLSEFRPSGSVAPSPSMIAHSESYANLALYEIYRESDPKSRTDVFPLLISYWSANFDQTRKKSAVQNVAGLVKAALSATKECRQSARTDCKSPADEIGYMYAFSLLSKQDFDQALSLTSSIEDPYERFDIKQTWIRNLLRYPSE